MAIVVLRTSLGTILDSVGFEAERLAEKYSSQREITVADSKVESSPKRFKGDGGNRGVELEALELILKLWLLRIHLTEEEGGRRLRDFEAEINNTQRDVIQPYKAVLLSRKSREPEELLMQKLDTNLERACTKLLEEKKKVNFEMPEDDRRRLNMESAFVCSVLGLKIDFLDSLEGMESQFRGHWTVEEWIVTFLQSNYHSLETKEKTSLTKDLLGKIGFDPSSSSIETILKRADEMQNHIEACEWAEIFIADEFKYNPLLSPFVPKFTTGKSSGFHPQSKPDEESETIEQQLYPYHNDFLVTLSQDLPITLRQQDQFLRNCGLLDDTRKTLLFHGTDHQSADDILNRGIYLPAGKQKRDFSSGKGFYLTKSFDQALMWARSTTAKPAILIFQVKGDCLRNAKKLDLTNDLEEWRKTVHYFRSDEGPAKIGKEIRKSYDLIEGPVATARRNETTGQLVWEPKRSSYQLCLISDDFAKKLGQTCLHSIRKF